jgi:hypothetical protein
MAGPAGITQKLERYRRFWSGAPVERPLVGFSLGGWFSLKVYQAMQRFRGGTALSLDRFRPGDFFDDYDRWVSQFDRVEDDVLRAVAPIPPFPWLEAMLGASVEVGPEAVWTREGGFDYADLERLDFSPENPWRRKYLEFVAALADRYRGRLAVGQPILRGVSDMIACLRGSQQMVFDLYDRPEDFRRLARACSDFFIGFVKAHQDTAGPFGGGHMIEQFTLWAPDKIIRMQEDASALFSPSLYGEHLQEEDWRQASAFPYSLIHLHASSLHLLDRILEVDSLKCIQINKDAGGTQVEWELPYFLRVQEKGKRLLIRGKLTLEELGLIRKNLSPRGLFLQVVVEDPEETRALGEFFRPWE